MWLSFSPGAMNDINKLSTEAMVVAVAGNTKARYSLPCSRALLVTSVSNTAREHVK